MELSNIRNLISREYSKLRTSQLSRKELPAADEAILKKVVQAAEQPLAVLSSQTIT